jgi:NAD(P)H-flavin reductase/ferredoxin
MHQATLTPGGDAFEIIEGETVLDAALRQGVPLQYGCRHGNCSSCKHFLDSGDVDHGGASIYSLTESERDDGYALLCCARPLTDLVIVADNAADVRTLPLLKPSEQAAEVVDVQPLTRALWQLRLRLPIPMTFYPGQFAELNAPGSDFWRSYSIASAPHDPHELDFVIKQVDGGRFSTRLTALSSGAKLRVRGPFGTSYLREGTAPVLLVAIGSGISPVLSILRHAAHTGDPRRFEFYYGARTVDDLPLGAEFTQLAQKLGERLVYRPVLSRAGDDWRGLRGRVTQAVQRELADARPYDAYLCGVPEMCDSIGTLLEAKGIRAGQLFYDKFHAAG